jgi:hypothetical protein
MRRGRALVGMVMAATAVTASFATPGASAGANHELTRTSGTVSATLSWRGDFQETRNFRIQISRGAAVLVNEPVEIADCGTGMETPGFACPWPVGEKPLQLRDLDGDGEPEAVITAFTGGAHCCVVALIYRWDGAEYVTAERNFGGAGWRLVDLDRNGTIEFRTSDYQFDFLYGSHAESVFPIQIISFDDGRFADVTTDFPGAIAKDAERLGRYYERRATSRKRLGVRAALAAYAADIYLLGQNQRARRELRKALEAGVLERNRFDPAGPWGRKFIRDLKRNLRLFGYIGA